MNYVYVPYRVNDMDLYAGALVSIKNKKNKVFGQHKLIARGLSEQPLSVVGWRDSLYVLIHGSGRATGVGVDMSHHDGEARHVTGEDFAARLIGLGLRRTTIDLRLWTCWGAGKHGDDDRMGPDGQESEPFAMRVARGLAAGGYVNVTVSSYRKLVNLSVANLDTFKGHKVLQTSEGFARVTANDRVSYKVANFV